MYPCPLIIKCKSYDVDLTPLSQWILIIGHKFLLFNKLSRQKAKQYAFGDRYWYEQLSFFSFINLICLISLIASTGWQAQELLAVSKILFVQCWLRQISAHIWTFVTQVTKICVILIDMRLYNITIPNSDIYNLFNFKLNTFQTQQTCILLVEIIVFLNTIS